MCWRITVSWPRRIEMGDYSFVREGTGRVCGLWLKDPSCLDRPGLVEVIIMKENCQHLLTDYLGKRYRKVPNYVNSDGGCFVMFGSVKAPGEK
jgi:hypothetical protein